MTNNIGLIITILVSILVISAVSPSISDAFNDTEQAFVGNTTEPDADCTLCRTSYPGVGALVGVLPILFIVGVVLMVFLGRRFAEE